MLFVAKAQFSHKMICTVLYFPEGLENRPKDVGLFFFWMALREENLDFLKANLFTDESASERNVDEKNADDESERSNYAKRKRREEETALKRHNAMKQEQVALLREFMTPNSNTNNESPHNEAVNQSIIAKNQACVNDKKCNALLTEALTRSERVNNLMKVMENPMVFGMYDEMEQMEMKRELKRLVSL